MTTAASTTSTQRSVRDERIAAKTSGIGSPVAVFCQDIGSDSRDALVSRSKSSSSIRCWVPIRVAFRRPTDPSAHRLWVALGSAGSFRHGQHCRPILQQPARVGNFGSHWLNPSLAAFYLI